MASDGSTIGRANVEIGADTSKLDAGLAVVKEKVQDSVSNTEAISREEMAMQLQAQAIAGEQNLNEVAKERVAIAALEAATEEELYQAKLQELAVTQELERRERARYLETQASTETLERGQSRFMRFLAGSNEELKQTHKLMGAIGRLGVFTAIAAAAFRAGRAIREYVISALEDGKDRAEKFKESLDLNDEEESIKSISAELNRLNGEIEEQIKDQDRLLIQTLMFNGVSRLQDQRRELEKTLNMLRQARQADRESQARNKEKKELEQQIQDLKNQINSLTSSTFGKIEVSVGRVAQLVELMANARRNDQ